MSHTARCAQEGVPGGLRDGRNPPRLRTSGKSDIMGEELPASLCQPMKAGREGMCSDVDSGVHGPESGKGIRSAVRA